MRKVQITRYLKPDSEKKIVKRLLSDCSGHLLFTGLCNLPEVESELRSLRDKRVPNHFDGIHVLLNSLDSRDV